MPPVLEDMECLGVGVAGRVALDSPGLGAWMLLCEPDGERYRSGSETGFTICARSMLAEAAVVRE